MQKVVVILHTKLRYMRRVLTLSFKHRTKFANFASTSKSNLEIILGGLGKVGAGKEMS
jgi:hypothetical protein